MARCDSFGENFIYTLYKHKFIEGKFLQYTTSEQSQTTRSYLPIHLITLQNVFCPENNWRHCSLKGPWDFIINSGFSKHQIPFSFWLSPFSLFTFLKELPCYLKCFSSCLGVGFNATNWPNWSEHKNYQVAIDLPFVDSGYKHRNLRNSANLYSATCKRYLL